MKILLGGGKKRGHERKGGRKRTRPNPDIPHNYVPKRQGVKEGEKESLLIFISLIWPLSIHEEKGGGGGQKGEERGL